MPIDASIYSQLKAPQIQDPMQSMGRAMQMRNMQRQNQMQDQKMAQQQSIRDAFKQNIVQGDDGTQSLNQKGVVSDLYGAGAYEKASNLQNQFKQQERQDYDYDLKKKSKQIEMAKKLTWGVSDQNSWSTMLEQAQALGLPNVDKLPKEYDPQLANRMKTTLLNAEEQLAEKWRQKNYGLEQQKINAAKMKANSESKNKINTEANKLGKEWRKNPTTKKTAEVATSFERIKRMMKDPSPAGDLSLVFNYMKMLDPGSVVRESEFRSAEQARSAISKFEESGIPVPAFLKQGVQKLQNGQFLLPEQRVDFGSRAQSLYEAQMAQQNRVNETYGRVAQKQNMDPSLVVDPRLHAVEPMEQPKSEFSPDVLNYAQKHGITPQQAGAIKQQRMSQMAGGQ